MNQNKFTAEKLARLAREDKRSISSYTALLIKRTLEGMNDGK